MASLGRNMTVIGSFALVAVLALGGFVLSEDKIPHWWIWGYWSSPMMYRQTALSVNEFLGHSWKHVSPGSNKTLGVSILKSRHMKTKASILIDTFLLSNYSVFLVVSLLILPEFLRDEISVD